MTQSRPSIPSDPRASGTPILPGQTVVVTNTPDQLAALLAPENLLNLLLHGEQLENVLLPPPVWARQAREELSVCATDGVRVVQVQPRTPTELDRIWDRSATQNPGLGF